MEISLLILEAAGKLKKTAAGLFKDFDLSPPQFNVLHLLASEPEGMRSGDLAIGLVVDPSNITGLISRLEAEGLVKTAVSKEDRRSRRVTLTAKGRARWQKAHAVYSAALAKLEATMSAEERAVTERVIVRLHERCDDLLR